MLHLYYENSYILKELNGPLGDAVTESLEKSIRSTVDTFVGVAPPPNQP
jgi:hypothetical protein